MQVRDHWEQIYKTKPIDKVSWYQVHAETSLRLIVGTGAPLSAAVIDIGGGTSVLVDDLLAAGYTTITVLDISSAALAVARQRLGPAAERVEWLVDDITQAQLPEQAYDIWHDRAVFHFLTVPQHRRAYIAAVRRALRPGGHIIVATFADDGPLECSGLPVQRYSPDELHAEFGEKFALVRHEREIHLTPFGTKQRFVYCLCRIS
jgi:SAM-dependent methyltransferase